MTLPAVPANRATAADARNRRHHGRLRCEMVNTPLGKVIDLSATGLRVEGRGRINLFRGQNVFLTLQSLEGEFRVKAEVVWVRQRRGLRRNYAVGFHFLDLTPALRHQIACLAVTSVRKLFVARNNRVIDHGCDPAETED